MQFLLYSDSSKQEILALEIILSLVYHIAPFVNKSTKLLLLVNKSTKLLLVNKSTKLLLVNKYFPSCFATLHSHVRGTFPISCRMMDKASVLPFRRISSVGEEKQKYPALSCTYFTCGWLRVFVTLRDCLLSRKSERGGVSTSQTVQKKRVTVGFIFSAKYTADLMPSYSHGHTICLIEIDCSSSVSSQFGMQN